MMSKIIEQEALVTYLTPRRKERKGLFCIKAKKHYF